MSIPTIRPAAEKIDETAVTAIENLLARAKSGEIISFVSVSQLKGGGWFEQSSGVSNMFQQLGMAEMATAVIRERMMCR